MKDTELSRKPVKTAVLRPQARIGRPSMYTEELGQEFCSRIAEGRSLRSVCTDGDMPGTRGVFNWFERYPNFAQQYTRAKEASADSIADEIQQIAEDVLSGKIPPKAGHVAGNLKMWTAAKLKPRVYGERLDVTSNGEALPTPTIYLPSELPYQAINLHEAQAVTEVDKHKRITDGEKA